MADDLALGAIAWAEFYVVVNVSYDVFIFRCVCVRRGRKLLAQCPSLPLHPKLK
ncbi:MAG TPA: hypothetical protein VLV18_01605 [Terriglobales bacterium]|nr:hypothetical protein [Terriglobales bacterium]